MLTWDDDWPALQARLDEEHRQLHRLLESMRAVIDTTPSRALLAEALAVFVARLGLHFGMEENLLRPRDPKGHAILAAEHSRMMRQLAELGSSRDRQTISDGIAQTLVALEHHEREVDTALFRQVFGNPLNQSLFSGA